MSNGQPSTRSLNLLGIGSRKLQIVSTLLATLLACIVLLTLLGHKPLTNWDEGSYPEFPPKMPPSTPSSPTGTIGPGSKNPPSCHGLPRSSSGSSALMSSGHALVQPSREWLSLLSFIRGS